MNCKKCDFELVKGQDICPRCGVSQSDAQDDSPGITMELPTTVSSSSNKDVKVNAQKKEKPKAEKIKAKTKAKEVADKAKKGAKIAANKVKDVSKEVVESVGDATQDVSDVDEKSKSKTWLYALIGIVGAAVVIFIAILIIGYEPKGADELKFVNMASTEDEVYIVDGDTLIEIAEVPEDVSVSGILTAISSNSFYLIDDAEYDDEIGEFSGDLVYLKSNGKTEDIDNDVIVDSQTIIGGLLWYERADKDEKVVCCYDGKKITEVIEEDTLSNWVGTDKVGKAYYSLMDEDDYSTEIFVVENGDSESIMDEAQIITVSSDFKKLLLISEDEDDNTLMIYDGKDDFEVIDDLQDILLDIDTFDMIVIADAEDMVLYYIPYGKDEIEIDDEVDEILSLPNIYTSYFTDDLGGMIYYGKEDDLYVADFKGKDTDRILKDYEELDTLFQEDNFRELVYVDDDEIVMINIDTLKETSIELPDADELNSYDVVKVGNFYVYRTEDNKEIFAYNGRGKDAIELSDDADEIISFQAFMDKYVLWTNVDEELVISEIKEDSSYEIGDEVSDFWITEDGQIYFLSDFEDGEGDLYYIPRVGKEAERIEKGITNLFRLYYD